jgi:hypothetical protein
VETAKKDKSKDKSNWCQEVMGGNLRFPTDAT